MIRSVRTALSILALLSLPAVYVGMRRVESHRLTPQPRGIVLGMYAGIPDYDYREELVRIARSGATCVTLQAIYRMETGSSNEIVRHPTSSPTERSLRLAFQQARELGLRVMFFPTINMRDEAENEQWWRGNIKPADWDLWWKNYTAFNVRLAALAEEGGVEWYSVGTEMASTHPFDGQWRHLIGEVRKVFSRKITYSVNFDSHDTFTFGDALDVVGMNTYDPIAKHDEAPTEGQIRDAWWWIVYKARTLQSRFNRPVMITEVGYPSVAGAHKGPWDFRSEKPVDLQLQDDLMKGAFKVLRNWGEGEAVFYYLYGENIAQKPVGGPNDRTYAMWGKPVEATVRAYFKEPIFEGVVKLEEQHRKEALVQVLASHQRKFLQYEDGALPAWVVAWQKSHPQDWAAALDVLKDEPVPAHKIPKGQEH